MAVVDEIAIKLGLQTGELKAALMDVNASIKQFGTEGVKHAEGLTGAIHEVHSSMRTFHQFMMAGGIVEAVKGFFEMAIKSAEANTSATDENAAAVRRFGEDMKKMHGDVGSIAMNIVGTFNRVGESIGGATRKVIEYFQAAVLGNRDNMEAQEAAEESEKRAEEMERAFAIEKKKYGEDFKRVNAEIKQTEASINDEKLKSMSSEQKLAALAEDRSKIQKEINSGTLNALQMREHELELLKNTKEEMAVQAEMQKKFQSDKIAQNKAELEAQLKGLSVQQQIKLLTDDLKSNQAIVTELKKSGADATIMEAQQQELVNKLTAVKGEAEKQILETKKKIIGTVQDELEYLALQHKMTLGIATGPEELRFKQIQQQRKEREIVLQLEKLTTQVIDEAGNAINQKLTPAEEKRYKELEKQKKKIDEQLVATGKLLGNVDALTGAAAAEANAQASVTAEYEKQVELASKLSSMAGSGSPLGLHNLGSISSDVLEAKVAELQREYDQGKIDWNSSGATGNRAVIGSTYENSNYYLASEIDSVKSELAFRAKLQAAFASGGRAGALQEFVAGGGDPLSFDTAMANMNSWSQGNTQTANQLGDIQGTLAKINGTIANVFPKASSAAGSG